KERSKALEDAKKVFDTLSKKDVNNSICWAAKAWIGACEMEMQNKSGWETVFKQIRADAQKNVAAADGVRMVEFFELQNKYQDARASNAKAAVISARSAAQTWLNNDRYKNRMTPERLSVTFYYALLSGLLGQSEIVTDKDPKDPKKTIIKSVPQSAKDYLLAANREYKKLTDFDNEYTDRANRRRTQIIRLLVANADALPSLFLDFEQAQMAALVQLDQANNKDNETTQATYQAKAIALLERARALAATAPTAKDAADAQVQLAYTYLTSGRPQQAAILGEHIARTARPGSVAVKGGYLAVSGYLAARDALPEEEEDARSIDRNRAVQLAEYIHTTYPTDPVTDAVRFRLGRLYAEEKDYIKAFEMLGKIGQGYAGVTIARTIEGRVAYSLLVAKENKLTPEQKAAIFRKATTDGEAVAEPSKDAPTADVKAYLALRTLLAQLHLTNVPAGQARAEQIAAEALAKAPTFTNLDEDGKKAVGFQADEVRLRAVYAQAAPLYRDAKYADLAKKLSPSLVEMAKGGPANTGLKGEAAIAADNLDKFRREIIVLGLQGKIREGNVDQAGELFDLLERLGGTAEATADALTRLVGL
ncbi:MAG: hypothetical protein ACRCZF_25440, partial [Gemmataceae bacterium]